MTGFVLNMTALVLNVTIFVLHMTRFVLNKAGFVQNLTKVIILGLLSRLNAQTLLNASLPISKIHPLGKIAVTVKPMMQF